MGIVLGCFLIGIAVQVLRDGLLHRAMDEPREHRRGSAVPDAHEPAGQTGTDGRDRV